MKRLLYIISVIFCFVSFENKVSAEEHSELYIQVESITEGEKIEKVDGEEKITTLLDDAGNILVAEVYNEETDTYITTTSTESEIIIEKKIKGHVVRETYPYLKFSEDNLISEATFSSNTNENIVSLSIREKDFRENLLSFKYNQRFNLQKVCNYFGKWEYTGVAIPAGAVASLVNIGYSAFATSIGGLFGISTGAANAMLAFMGVGGSVGEIAARGLDTNGNGWIGLYKRGVRGYCGGPFIYYEHKTN